MKARLNLTIDSELLITIKAYAMNKNRSVSELVEDYFKELAKTKKRKKNIIDLVAELEKPDIDPSLDLKEEYYKDRAKKYGF